MDANVRSFVDACSYWALSPDKTLTPTDAKVSPSFIL